MKPGRLLSIVWLCLLLAGCSDKPLSPEDEIRQYIDQGIAAAENRDTTSLVEMIHGQYSDRRGMTPKTLKSTLQLYFFRHKNIHLFKRIDEIILRTSSEASVSLYVAMAGSVISDASVLSGLRARIYHFDLSLIKEDEWKLKEATWKPATVADLQRTY